MPFRYAHFPTSGPQLPFRNQQPSREEILQTVYDKVSDITRDAFRTTADFCTFYESVLNVAVAGTQATEKQLLLEIELLLQRTMTVNCGPRLRLWAERWNATPYHYSPVKATLKGLSRQLISVSRVLEMYRDDDPTVPPFFDQSFQTDAEVMKFVDDAAKELRDLTIITQDDLKDILSRLSYKDYVHTMNEIRTRTAQLGKGLRWRNRRLGIGHDDQRGRPRHFAPGGGTPLIDRIVKKEESPGPIFRNIPQGTGPPLIQRIKTENTHTRKYIPKITRRMPVPMRPARMRRSAHSGNQHASEHTTRVGIVKGYGKSVRAAYALANGRS